MNNIKVLFRRLHDKARVPKYKHLGDSGADLFAIENFVIRPGEIYSAKTGISISINEGIEAQIRPRSGLALKGLSVVNSPATIDSGYRGELKVPLINLGDEILKFKTEDRFAQIIFAPVYRANFIEVKNLDDSDRNSGGFGSTGL